jgi:acetyltransferase-like isoleucine patch superfamily enzyme
MGAFSYSHSKLKTYVSVGRYCSIGPGVTWVGDVHPHDWATTSPIAYDDRPLAAFRAYFADVGLAWNSRHFDHHTGVVKIGHDVWIGSEAMVMGGVTIGDGAVIGARALVLKDVPPYAVVTGAPAQVKRLRFPEAVVERFLRLAWWRFRPETVQALPSDEPERFLDDLEALIATAPPETMRPVTLGGAEILNLSAKA